jgi:hypothetical protein
MDSNDEKNKDISKERTTDNIDSTTKDKSNSTIDRSKQATKKKRKRKK